MRRALYAMAELSMSAEQILALGPCWEDAETRIPALFEQHGLTRATALDVLRCTDVDDEDALWLVLRTALIAPPPLPEFARRCAEHALARVEALDQRGIPATAAAWALTLAETYGKQSALACYVARVASVAAAIDVADTAAAAIGGSAVSTTWDTAYECERAWQRAELIRMLEAAQ